MVCSPIQRVANKHFLTDCSGDRHHCLSSPTPKQHLSENNNLLCQFAYAQEIDTLCQATSISSSDSRINHIATNSEQPDTLFRRQIKSQYTILQRIRDIRYRFQNGSSSFGIGKQQRTIFLFSQHEIQRDTSRYFHFLFRTELSILEDSRSSFFQLHITYKHPPYTNWHCRRS